MKDLQLHSSQIFLGSSFSSSLCALVSKRLQSSCAIVTPKRPFKVQVNDWLSAEGGDNKEVTRKKRKQGKQKFRGEILALSKPQPMAAPCQDPVFRSGAGKHPWLRSSPPLCTRDRGHLICALQRSVQESSQ